MDAHDYRPGEYGVLEFGWVPDHVKDGRNKKGQWLKGHTPHNKGKRLTETHSPEMIAKIMSGLRHDPDTARKAQAASVPKCRKPVLRINPKSGEIVRYESLTLAAQLNGNKAVTVTHIGRVCRQARVRQIAIRRGKRYEYFVCEKHFHGFKWFYESDTERWQ